MSKVKDYLVATVVTLAGYYIYKEFIGGLSNMKLDDVESVIDRVLDMDPCTNDTKVTPNENKMTAISIMTDKAMETFYDSTRLEFAEKIFNIAKDADPSTKDKAMKSLSKISSNALRGSTKDTLMDYISKLV